MTKEEAREIMDEVCTQVCKKISKLSAENSKLCLAVVKDYSDTNCGWMNFWMKGVLIKTLESHIKDLENGS